MNKKQKMRTTNFFILCLFLAAIIGNAQDVLTKEAALKIALENNFDIQIANKSVEIAKNNTSIINGGYLPSVSANASSRYTINTGEAEFNNGNFNAVSKAKSDRNNASLDVGYSNVNIYGLIQNLKKLKQQYNLSELQAKLVMENTLQTLFFAYYEVAQLSENLRVQKKNYEISQKRLERVKLGFEYGQQTKLDLLNAEVDVNKDKVNLLESERTLNNAKRDLNIVLGRDVETAVEVEGNVSYIFGLNKNKLLIAAKNNNTQISQQNKAIELSEFDVKISKSGWMPSVSLTGSYAWSKNNFDQTSQLVYNLNKGINYGVGLSWNIFDAGRSVNNVRNAKITLDSKKVEREKSLASLEKEVGNSWQNYQNLLAVLKLQKTNLEVNELNYQRSEEYFKLGQINSIDYRQAQLNLLNAELSLNAAKYNAKNAELQLLKLSGGLLENKNF